MGKPLMIQKEDDYKIEDLKKRLKIPTKIGVIRAAIILLEAEASRQERIKHWKQAVALVAKNSREVNKEFQRHSRIKK